MSSASENYSRFDDWHWQSGFLCHSVLIERATMFATSITARRSSHYKYVAKTRSSAKVASKILNRVIVRLKIRFAQFEPVALNHAVAVALVVVPGFGTARDLSSVRFSIVPASQQTRGRLRGQSCFRHQMRRLPDTWCLHQNFSLIGHL